MRKFDREARLPLMILRQEQGEAPEPILPGMAPTSDPRTQELQALFKHFAHGGNSREAFRMLKQRRDQADQATKSGHVSCSEQCSCKDWWC